MTGTIKLRLLWWKDYPVLSKWAQCNLRVLKRWKRKRVREDVMMETEVGGMCFKMEEKVTHQGMQATPEARKLRQNFP